MDKPQRHRGTEVDRPLRHAGTEGSHINVPGINLLTAQILSCAIEVHRALGPGLLESLYETALCIELEDRGMMHARQTRVPAYYKGRLLGDYRVDLIVEDLVLVEVKSVERWNPVFEAQMLTCLRLTDQRVGLAINFNSRLLKEGVRRIVL